MKVRVIRLSALAAVGIGVALSVPLAAHAGDGPVAGGRCSAVGAAVMREGGGLRCERHRGDDCPRWRAVAWSPPCRCTPPSHTPPSRSARPSHTTSQHPSGRPSHHPSPSTTVTVTATATATATATVVATAPAPTRGATPPPVSGHAAGGSLPVTGPPVGLLAGAGTFLLAFGGLTRWLTRRRRTN